MPALTSPSWGVIPTSPRRRQRTSANRGASVDCVIADISKPSECARVADEVMATRGGIEVLCANAGMFTGKKLADMTEADFDETFDLNMKGCPACRPAFQHSRPRVMAVSS